MVTDAAFEEWGGQRLPLHELLHLHRSAKAADPRDKVYALIGLSRTINGREIKIVPNYTKSAAPAYTEVAARIIMTMKTLNMLSVPKRSLVADPNGGSVSERRR